MRRREWSSPRSIPVRKITASHAVEASRHTPRRFLSAPIYVIPVRGLFSTRYRIHDGNRRLRDAVARGDRTIRAHVATS